MQAANAIRNSKVGENYSEKWSNIECWCLCSPGKDGKWYIAKVDPDTNNDEQIGLAFVRNKPQKFLYVYIDIENSKFYRFFENKEDAEKGLKTFSTISRAGREDDRYSRRGY